MRERERVREVEQEVVHEVVHAQPSEIRLLNQQPQRIQQISGKVEQVEQHAQVGATMKQSPRKRQREYTIYARAPGVDFTVKSEAYSRGTHMWRYDVYATSIRQAYFLAARETFAPSARDVGIREMESDWWHFGFTPEAAEAARLRRVAPYLKQS